MLLKIQSWTSYLLNDDIVGQSYSSGSKLGPDLIIKWNNPLIKQ